MSPRPLFVLLALIALPAYAGDHAHPGNSLERRTPIHLTAEEKAHIHLEMRLFLSTTQKIVNGAAANDMKLVADAAREAGSAAAHEVPAKVREKQATHQGFDDLARDAESLADANQALRQLGSVLSNCVSCHAMYRLETGKR